MQYGPVDALAKLASPTFTVFNHALPRLTGTREASSLCMDYSQTSHKDSKQVIKLYEKNADTPKINLKRGYQSSNPGNLGASPNMDNRAAGRNTDTGESPTKCSKRKTREPVIKYQFPELTFNYQN